VVEQEHRYSIRKACMTLGISRSGFYAYCARKPSDRQLENEVLSQKICEVFEQHSGRYGAKRIACALKDEGFKVNRKRVVKLMRRMASLQKVPEERTGTTISTIRTERIPMCCSRISPSTVETRCGWEILPMFLRMKDISILQRFWTCLHARL